MKYTLFDLQTRYPENSKKLILTCEMLDDSDLANIGLFIRGRSIEELDIRGNNFSSAALKSFASNINSNTSIYRIKIFDPWLDVEIFADIDPLLPPFFYPFSDSPSSQVPSNDEKLEVENEIQLVTSRNLRLGSYLKKAQKYVERAKTNIEFKFNTISPLVKLFIQDKKMDQECRKRMVKFLMDKILVLEKIQCIGEVEIFHSIFQLCETTCEYNKMQIIAEKLYGLLDKSEYSSRISSICEATLKKAVCSLLIKQDKSQLAIDIFCNLLLRQLVDNTSNGSHTVNTHIITSEAKKRGIVLKIFAESSKIDDSSSRDIIRTNTLHTYISEGKWTRVKVSDIRMVLDDLMKVYVEDTRKFLIILEASRRKYKCICKQKLSKQMEASSPDTLTFSLKETLHNKYLLTDNIRSGYKITRRTVNRRLP